MSHAAPKMDATALARASLPRVMDALKARVQILKAAADLQVGDAERVAFHVRREAERRNGQRTRNNLLFAHGSNAEVGGYLDVDDLALCGLEASGDLYALWVGLAACAMPGASRGELIRLVFRDPARVDWCRKEGARVRWHFAKAAYDAELEVWRTKTVAKDQLAAWRKNPPTERQAYMVALICARADLPVPPLMRRGRTHDWIEEHGGAPRFWEAPPPPEEWSV